MSIYKDLVNWYFDKRSLPYWSIVFIDVLLCFIATIFVLWLFSSASWILGNLPVVLHTVGLLLLIDIIMFKVFHRLGDGRSLLCGHPDSLSHAMV